jgi:hypothetical protein
MKIIFLAFLQVHIKAQIKIIRPYTYIQGRASGYDFNLHNYPAEQD